MNTPSGTSQTSRDLPTITVEGLSKAYSRRQRPAIQGVDFKVNDGEILGFVGLNGAGKTTTIRVAAGVSLPTVGGVKVDGVDIVSDKAEACRRIGWVPEIPNFEPNSKALALMKYFCGFYGIAGSASEAKSMELMRSVGLSGSERRKFREYSQGMKKKFSLAVSLLSDPQNFLFDELLNGLDPEGIHYFRSLVTGLRKDGKAVLLSSHILAEVQNVADRVVFIHKGKIINTVSVSDLGGLRESRLKISIKNLDEGALALLRGFGEVEAEGSVVNLRGASAEASDINAKLVGKGYRVSALTAEKAGLEEYFFRIVKEAEGT